MKKFNNLNDVFNYLDTINDINNLRYLDSKWHSFENEDWYKKILEEVLKDRPKRVVDIGSNLNQYGYLFENENIEYIGIDIITEDTKENGIIKPLETENIKFIGKNYYEIREKFKDDIIISCLCVGYLIPYEDVLCKKLIVNSFDENNNVSAKVVERNID